MQCTDAEKSTCDTTDNLLDFISITAKQFKLFLSLLGCTKDEHCTGDPNKKYCDTTYNVCVSIKGELRLHFKQMLHGHMTLLTFLTESVWNKNLLFWIHLNYETKVKFTNFFVLLQKYRPPAQTSTAFGGFKKVLSGVWVSKPIIKHWLKQKLSMKIFFC